jgi:hypothetical protein
MSNLEALIEKLRAFGAGASDRAALQHWSIPFRSAPILEGPDDEEPIWNPEAEDQALFWTMLDLFEDEGFSSEEHREFASQLVRLFDEVSPSARRLELLPLLIHRRQFCEVLQKHRAGIISRTGLVSVISKRFRFEPVKDWLLLAPTHTLEELCDRLGSEDYTAVENILSRPPA